MFDKQQVLGVAMQRIRTDGYVDYGAFEEFRPGTNNRWLHRIKEVLLESGFQCHMYNDRAKWADTCGYLGRKTHFHRAATLGPNYSLEMVHL